METQTGDAFQSEDEQPVLGSRVERFARRPWYTRPVAVIFAVTALAGGLRLWHLSTPKGYVFDEVYYAKDGCFDAGYPFLACNLNAPGEQTVTVHPPIGREIIAVSERLFGNDEFGWRFASAVFGTLSVLALTILAWKLFESLLWGAAAGLLLATENLNLVQSRISMLDIFVVTFVVAGFMFLVLDRRWIDRRTPEPQPPSDLEEMFGVPVEPPPAPILRPYRILAGASFGLAAATKWSGAAALLGGVVLAVAWERTRRRRAGAHHPIRETLRDEGFGIFVFLILLPVALYMVSYARWYAHNGFDLGAWWRLQRGMLDYSLSLRATHPYASPAWTWVLMLRPVAYYYTCAVKQGTTCVKAAEILGMGNPLIFWATVITIPYALIAWIRKRDWRAGLIVVAFGLQYVPWLFARRTSFLFYMAPITPFMVMALVYLARDVSTIRVGIRDRSLAWVSAVIVSISLATFVYFWPVLIGQTISFSAWQQRVWVLTLFHKKLLNWI